MQFHNTCNSLTARRAWSLALEHAAVIIIRCAHRAACAEHSGNLHHCALHCQHRVGSPSATRSNVTTLQVRDSMRAAGAHLCRGDAHELGLLAALHAGQRWEPHIAHQLCEQPLQHSLARLSPATSCQESIWTAGNRKVITQASVTT